MVKVPTAREFFAKWYVSLSPNMDVYDAIHILQSKKASGAPVLDSEGRLLGILTEKDCLRVLTNASYEQLAQGVVADFMSEMKVAIEPDEDLFSVAQKFLSTNFAVLPVMADGKPIGRISRQDMLRAISRFERDVEREKLRDELQLKLVKRPYTIDDLQRLASNQSPEQMAAVLSNRYHD
ncbi:MAG: hypothetical protein AMXMBFR84_18420 [Candidatus Hydrogenedentota bacterium]